MVRFNKDERLYFLFSFLFSTIIFYNIIPKSNPYIFPDNSDIDSYTYLDDRGVCYKYERVYKKCSNKVV